MTQTAEQVQDSHDPTQHSLFKHGPSQRTVAGSISMTGTGGARSHSGTDMLTVSAWFRLPSAMQRDGSGHGFVIFDTPRDKGLGPYRTSWRMRSDGEEGDFTFTLSLETGSKYLAERLGRCGPRPTVDVSYFPTTAGVVLRVTSQSTPSRM